jgi:predicted exporter
MIEWRIAKILLFGLVICAAVSYLLRHSADPTRAWPPKQTSAQKLLAQYQTDNIDTRLIVVGLFGPPPRELAHASHELRAALRETGLFLLVANGSAAQADIDRSFLWQQRFLLSPDVTVERFEAGQIKKMIEQKGSMTADPSDEFASVTMGMPSTRAKTLHDAWFSHDEAQALLFAVMRASDETAQQAAVESIRRAHAALSSGTRLLLAGQAVSRARGGAGLWSFAMVLLIAWGIVLLRRDWREVLIALLSAAAAITLGLTAVVLLFGRIEPSTFAMTPLLVALIGVLSMPDLQRSIDVKWPARLGAGALPNSVTPLLAAGTAALLLSPLIAVAQCGLFLSFGMVVGCVTLNSFRLRDHLATRNSLLAAWRRRAVAWIAIDNHRVLSVNASVIVFAFTGALLVHQFLAPARDPAELVMRGELGLAEPDAIVAVEGMSRESVLERAESVVPLLRASFAQRTIIAFDSPTRYLPSESAQLARQSALPVAEELLMELAPVLGKPRSRVESFAGFFDDLDNSRGGAVTLESVAPTSFAARVLPMLRSDGDKSIAWLSLFGVADYAAIAGNFDAFLDDVTLVNVVQEATLLRTRAVMTGGLAALAILLLSVVSLRRALGPMWIPCGAMTIAANLALLVWTAVMGTLSEILAWLPICVGACVSAYALYIRRHDLQDLTRLGACVIALLGLVAVAANANAVSSAAGVAILSSLLFLSAIGMLVSVYRRFRPA